MKRSREELLELLDISERAENGDPDAIIYMGIVVLGQKGDKTEVLKRIRDKRKKEADNGNE